MEVFKSAKLSFLVNGIPHGYFKCSQGVSKWKGSSLSMAGQAALIRIGGYYGVLMFHPRIHWFFGELCMRGCQLKMSLGILEALLLPCADFTVQIWNPLITYLCSVHLQHISGMLSLIGFRWTWLVLLQPWGSQASQRGQIWVSNPYSLEHCGYFFLLGFLEFEK